MGKSSNFEATEQKVARNFVERIQQTHCQQVIYLSGIVNDDHLSKHLRSRKQVEDVLFSGSVPVTVLRAGIIIGSGGASFEIIRDLVEKLPVMVAPRWLNTKSQPVALRNVLQYLHGVMLERKSVRQSVRYRWARSAHLQTDAAQVCCKVRDLPRRIITVPFLSPRLSSLWLYFVTSTSFGLARSLVDSMKNEVIVQKKGIEEIVSIDRL